MFLRQARNMFLSTENFDSIVGKVKVGLIGSKHFSSCQDETMEGMPRDRNRFQIPVTAEAKLTNAGFRAEEPIAKTWRTIQVSEMPVYRVPCKLN